MKVYLQGLNMDGVFEVSADRPYCIYLSIPRDFDIKFYNLHSEEPPPDPNFMKAEFVYKGMMPVYELKCIN